LSTRSRSIPPEETSATSRSIRARDGWKWQSQLSHFYSGVVGDLEGEEFFLTLDKSKRGYRYEVLRVIPEHLLVFSQPLPEPGEEISVPGHGVVSPGFHVFMLNEHDGKTVATILMQHASRWPTRPKRRR
jgi:hypothetical protein